MDASLTGRQSARSCFSPAHGRRCRMWMFEAFFSQALQVHTLALEGPARGRLAGGDSAGSSSAGGGSAGGSSLRLGSAGGGGSAGGSSLRLGSQRLGSRRLGWRWLGWQWLGWRRRCCC